MKYRSSCFLKFFYIAAAGVEKVRHRRPEPLCRTFLRIHFSYSFSRVCLEAILPEQKQ